MKIELPKNIIELAQRACRNENEFRAIADGLVQLERVRKTVKLKHDVDVSDLWRQYKSEADSKKQADAPFEERSSRMRGSLMNFLAAEREAGVPAKDSVTATPIEGLQFKDRDIILVSDLEELVRAVAAGEASIDLLKADMAVIKERYKALGNFAAVPGVSKHREKTLAISPVMTEKDKLS